MPSSALMSCLFYSLQLLLLYGDSIHPGSFLLLHDYSALLFSYYAHDTLVRGSS